jgi:hypothetical protein
MNPLSLMVAGSGAHSSGSRTLMKSLEGRDQNGWDKDSGSGYGDVRKSVIDRQHVKILPDQPIMNNTF